MNNGLFFLQLAFNLFYSFKLALQIQIASLLCYSDSAGLSSSVNPHQTLASTDVQSLCYIAACR